MECIAPRRMTEQRRIILEELRKVTSHPTADELHQMVRKRLPKISIATVYRNLEILSEDGEVLKIDLPGTQMRFDGTTANHYHIRCMDCGKVGDVSMEPFTGLNEIAERGCNYEVRAHRIEFIGICPHCRNNGQAHGK
jgi:Fur family transcriptional regulator, ferric uptake regulator